MATTQNIQSVERALSILEIYKEERRELSLKEIAQEMGISKSTTFGLVNTLSNLGYLQQNRENAKYSLGFKILSLSNAVQKNNILVQIVRPYLQSLSDEFQETLHCAIEENGTVMYIDKIEAIRSVYIKSEIGTKNYLHCTAVGKCFLSHMPEDRVEKLLNGKLRKLTYNTITSKTKLKKEIENVCKKGFALDNEETELGLICIAVPVFNDKKEVIVAVSLSGPSSRLNEIMIKKIVTRLKEASSSITSKLDY